MLQLLKSAQVVFVFVLLLFLTLPVHGGVTQQLGQPEVVQPAPQSRPAQPVQVPKPAQLPQQPAQPALSASPVQRGQATQPTQQSPQDPKCLQPLEPGPCRMSLDRFYYNSQTKKCEPFKFGGCRGNDNRFGFMKTCEDACVRS